MEAITLAKKRKDENEEQKNHEQEEGQVEIKDKRRVNPDGTLREEYAKSKSEEPAEPEQKEPAREPEAEPERPKSEPEQPRAEAAGPEQEEFEHEAVPPPDVYAVLQFTIGLLADQAWQLMGLVPPPGQKEITKDLEQAKIAIDTVVFIVDKIRPHVDEEQRRALQTLISNLQINFVQQSQ